MRTCERNSPADTRVSEGGEGGNAPGTGTEIPPAAPGGATAEQVDVPEGACEPVGDLWEEGPAPRLEQPVPEGLHATEE